MGATSRSPPDIRPSSSFRRAKSFTKRARRSAILIFLATDVSGGKSGRDGHLRMRYALGLVSAFVSPKSIGRYIVQISGNAVRIEPNRMHEAGYGLRML